MIPWYYICLQEFIRRCLTYNQEDRPDVLTIAQDQYLIYSRKWSQSGHLVTQQIKVNFTNPRLIFPMIICPNPWHLNFWAEKTTAAEKATCPRRNEQQIWEIFLSNCEVFSFSFFNPEVGFFFVLFVVWCFF